jgi:ABC-type antimicrobial peptide transport system permease subunit
MAIINFVNMSVSRSTTRMREIGIRKVLGGLKSQLIIQFLIESIILVFFSTIFAFIIYLITQDLFSNILGREIPVLSAFPIYFIVFPVILVFGVGFIAGIYPAFVLSSLRVVASLKGKLTSVKENVLFRKSLIAFQFCTATIVFIGAIIISKQINLFFSKDLGYNKDYIVSAALPRNWTPAGVRKMENIRNQFAAMPEVSTLSLSFEIPDGGNSGSVSLYKVGTDSTTAIPSPILMTDEYYASTYSIPMAAGVFFCQSGAYTDSFRLVINEAQAKAFGWKNAQDAIGKQVKLQGGSQSFTIAGVTKDFHFGSMQQAIQPVTFLHVGLTNTFRLFSFKLKPGNIANSMAALQKKWSALMPGTPFEYTFMDDTLKKLYKSEIQLKKASYTATVLSLIIVLMGVLGLISLTLQKRTKEIGIRKVLGSSVTNIVMLFMKEFLLVILISGIISCPLAYLLMQKWLSDYVYRIDITVQPFIISILLLGFITAVLIIMQTIKTAFANPVKSLRIE